MVPEDQGIKVTGAGVYTRRLRTLDPCSLASCAMPRTADPARMVYLGALLQVPPARERAQL